MANMKKYISKVDTEKKVVTIDKSVKATAEDDKLLQMYVTGGYTVRYKSEARSKKMKKRADGLNSESIRKALEGNQELLNKYNEILSGKGEGTGFFAAKSWYLKEVKNKDSKKK